MLAKEKSRHQHLPRQSRFKRSLKFTDIPGDVDLVPEGAEPAALSGLLAHRWAGEERAFRLERTNEFVPEGYTGANVYAGRARAGGAVRLLKAEDILGRPVYGAERRETLRVGAVGVSAAPKHGL